LAKKGGGPNSFKKGGQLSLVSSNLLTFLFSKRLGIGKRAFLISPLKLAGIRRERIWAHKRKVIKAPGRKLYVTFLGGGA